jgi:hypothetical protein
MLPARGLEVSNPKLTGVGWAWEFQDLDGKWVICNWAVPFKEWLKDDYSKPSDEARPIRVEIIPTSKRNRKRYGIKVPETSNV